MTRSLRSLYPLTKRLTKITYSVGIDQLDISFSPPPKQAYDDAFCLSSDSEEECERKIKRKSSTEIAEELQTHIDKLSNSSSDYALLYITLRNVDITPQIFRLLSELLNIPLPLPIPSWRPSHPFEPSYKNRFKLNFYDCNISECTRGQDHGDQDEGEGGNGKENENGNESSNKNRDKHICTLEDIHRSTKVGGVSVSHSPTVFDCLLNLPQLEMESLYIHDKVTLTESQCSRLGHLVQKSTNLKCLHLQVGGMEAPEQIAIPLGSARHLISLTLAVPIPRDYIPIRIQRNIWDIFIGKGRDQAITRLLQDPNSQLQHLHFHGCDLDDDHLIAILDLLPISRLQTLNVSNNNIQSRGVMEFSRRLPNIKFLTKIDFSRNPWEETTNTKECCEALVQGMMHNTSIVQFDSHRCSHTPQILLINKYCDMNFFRRNILSVSTPVPLGLWPRILERAQTKYYHFNPQSIIDYADEIIYFLLQHSPIPTLFYVDKGL